MLKTVKYRRYDNASGVHVSSDKEVEQLAGKYLE